MPVLTARMRRLPPSRRPSSNNYLPDRSLRLIVNYNASTVPILQLGLSGNGLTEPQLNDIALNFLRTQLVTVPGAAVPFPYGGKTASGDGEHQSTTLQAKGLSPSDVLTALGKEQLILPGGTAKIGQFEYDVDVNADLKKVSEFNDLPIKRVGNTIIYLRDVATVSDGFAPQTNIVRQDGKRGALVTVLKAGDASTIDVVKGVRQILPRVAQTLPPELKIQPLADQSIFVRGAINGVIREAVIAAALTGLMILIFLGSWRSTLIIAISIPLSILTSVIVLSFLHQTINIMTLGGLALAVGILVDDATVTIENIERHLEEGAELHDRHPGWCGADCRPCSGFDVVHLYRLFADVLSERCRGIPLCPAWRSGHLRHDRFLYFVPHAGAYPGDVPVKGSQARRRAFS
jgi:multidrug efflux pump subunit AcrB